MSVCNITGKRMSGFSWNFQQRSDMRPATIYNIFGMLWLTSWIQGRFFFFNFLDPRLLVMLWKMGERILLKFSWNVRDVPRNNWNTGELGPTENSAQAKTRPHGEVGPAENSAPRRTRPPTTAENSAPAAENSAPTKCLFGQHGRVYNIRTSHHCIHFHT